MEQHMLEVEVEVAIKAAGKHRPLQAELVVVVQEVTTQLVLAQLAQQTQVVGGGEVLMALLGQSQLQQVVPVDLVL
jgi:hypothetical protein